MTTLTYVAGSVEYLTVTVTADVSLTSQAVAISIDKGVTWLPAGWVGDAGTTRKARTTNPVTFAASTRATTVHVKVTDSPEVPIVKAGSYQVVSP